MRALRAGSAALLAVLILGGSALDARAQGDAAPDLRQLAERLTSPIRSRDTVRLAILPLTDAADRYQTADLASVRAALGAAVRDEATRRGRAWTVIEGRETDRVLAELNLPQPIGPSGAVLAGGMLNADVVILAALEGRGRDSRLSAQLLDARSRRALADAAIDIAIAPADRPAVATVAPPLAPPRGFWTGRKLAIVAGFGAAAGSGAIALFKEREVRDAKRRILAVPPGATDEFNHEVRAARQAERTRDFWWGAALGISGVTLAYVIASDSPNRRPHSAPVVSVPLPGNWLIGLHPAAARVWIGRGF